jgi:hypothetical protein
MSGTAFPGWYVEFQAGVLRQLPRPDELGQEVGEKWTNGQGALKKALATVLLPKESDKFGLFVDLGIITVPKDYVHETRLVSFEKENRKKFYGYNDAITDKNFGKATTKLVPGRKFRVKAFKQIVGGSTTSEERLAFLKTQNAILTGAQGASLVFEQKREDLPKGFWYCSFDEKEALWEDADGDHGVPCLGRSSGGGWDFSLGYFGGVWDDDGCLLCFCDCD